MAYRDYSTALGRIVDPNGRGDFTTIASAITAASSGQTIFIRPGTYTENLTPKDGVTLVGYNTTPSNAVVTIIGKLSVSSAVTASFINITFQTNADNILSITGTSNVTIEFNNCYFNASNNTAFSCTATAGTQTVNIFNCRATLGTTGIAYFSFTRGSVYMQNCFFGNSGSSLTSSTFSNGSSLTANNSSLYNPITSSNTASVALDNVIMRLGSGIDQTCLTLNGTGSVDIEFCLLESGTSSCISVGTGVTAEVYECTLDSSNANVVTGAGTLVFGGFTFTNGTSSEMNTTTQTARVFRPGISRSAKQPAFLATGGAVNNVTGSAATYDLGTTAVMTEIFDQNGDFFIGSGAGAAATFTAPFTGRYYLSMNCRTSGYVASTNMSYRIITTARTYVGFSCNPLNFASTGSGVVAGFSVLADMTVGDTAKFRIAATGEAGEIIDLIDSFISGYLAC